MSLRPKTTRFQKSQKKSIRLYVSKYNTGRTNNPKFGQFCLFSVESSILQGKHLEMGRRIIRNALQRKGLLWVCFFPHKPFTRKASGVGMGKGKGAVSFFGSSILPGQILYELTGVPLALASRAFHLVQKKLPIKTKIGIKRPLLFLFFGMLLWVQFLHILNLLSYHYDSYKTFY